MLENANQKAEAKRFYRKKVDLLSLLNKIKLWPSRTGTLHGLKVVTQVGEWLHLTTHCGRSFKVRNSRKSRAARWLRGKFCRSHCKACAVPDWKLAKYGSTFFRRHQGSTLRNFNT